MERDGSGWLAFIGLKGGCEKLWGLFWEKVEGEDSELANSSGVSRSQLLNCEIV